MAKTKKSNLAYKPTPLWHRNHFEHYARIDFSDASRNVPGVYDFLFDHLQPVLTELGEHSVELRIERLEPLDAVYTNLDVSPSQLKKILERFAKSHQLHHEKNFLSAVVPTKNLSKTLADYNVLFDLFFTDLVVSGKKLHLDMMDGFSNSILAMGEEKQLKRFESIVRKKVHQKIAFKKADHAHSRKHHFSSPRFKKVA